MLDSLLIHNFCSSYQRNQPIFFIKLKLNYVCIYQLKDYIHIIGFRFQHSREARIYSHRSNINRHKVLSTVLVFRKKVLCHNCQVVKI